jgi:hypothetical protein
MPDSELDLSKFYSIQPKFMHLKNQKNQNHIPLKAVQNLINGFELYYYENHKEIPNMYESKVIQFHHPHSETCRDWIEKITEFMPSK